MSNLLGYNQSDVNFVRNSNGVIATALVDLGYFVFVFFTCLLFFRQYVPIFKKQEKDELDEEEDITLKKLVKRVYQWLFQLPKEYRQFSTRQGKMAATFLYFERSLMFIYFFLCVYSLAVVVPIYKSGETPLIQLTNDTGKAWAGVYQYSQEDNWLLEFTISMVNSSRAKMCVPVITAYLFAFICFLFMYKFTNNEFISTQENPQLFVSNFSVHVKKLPFGRSVVYSQMEEKNLTDIANREFFEGSLKAFRVALKTTQRVDLHNELNETREYLNYFENSDKEKTYNIRYFWKYLKNKLMCFRFKREEIDPNWMYFKKSTAVAHYRKRERELLEMIYKWEKEFKKAPHSTGQGHIILRSKRTYDLACQYLGSKYDLDIPGNDEGFSFEIHKKAKEPSDIVWKNFLYSTSATRLRTFVIHVGMVVYVLIFSTPFTLVSNIMGIVFNLVQLGKDVFPSMIVVMDFLMEFFPTLFLHFVGSLIPTILPYLATFEKVKYKSRQVIVNCRRVYFYYILTTLILPSFFLTSFDGLMIYFYNPKNLVQIFSSMFLPSSGAFVMNYLIHNSFMSLISNLLNAGNIAKYLWLRIVAISDEEKERALGDSAIFRFGAQFACSLSYAAIVLCYSVFCPLVTVIAFLFVLIKYIIYRVNLMNLFRKLDMKKVDSESYALVLKNIFVLFLVNVLIFESFVLLYMIKLSFKDSFYLIYVGFVAVLIFISLNYGLSWVLTYEPKVVWDNEDESKDIEEFFSSKNLEECYKSPFPFFYHRPLSVDGSSSDDGDDLLMNLSDIETEGEDTEEYGTTDSRENGSSTLESEENIEIV